MILTKVEMMSAPGKTFMLTANVASANMQPKTQARIQQIALKTVRFAECGLFALSLALGFFAKKSVLA